jgi:carbon monoxide dehydrogenase subunit G
MEFENEFDVKAPVGDVYDTLMDVERVAPCMPGAEVLERTSDAAYKVGIKVKVGPVSMNYRGDVEIVERDPAEHSATMSVKAKEARGQGTATATVGLHLAEQNGGTHGTIDTDVRLSGRAAAMGQGIIGDVSARLVDQFAENLSVMLSEGQTADRGPQTAEPGPEAPPSPPPSEGLDALDLAAGVVSERMRNPRVMLVTVAVAVLLGYALGRLRRH